MSLIESIEHTHPQSFSPFGWLKKGSFQFLVKECVQILVNHLED